MNGQNNGYNNGLNNNVTNYGSSLNNQGVTNNTPASNTQSSSQVNGQLTQQATYNSLNNASVNRSTDYSTTERNGFSKIKAIIFLVPLAILLFLYFTKGYTVYFDNNDGSGEKVKKVSVKKLEDLELYTPTREGYVFNGWIIDNNKITKEIKLKASWTSEGDLNKVTITFDTDGGSSIKAKTIDYNEKITAPSVPTKNGYIFKYWTYNGKKYDFETKITSDMTLKAVYAKAYTVKFDTDGGSSIKNQTVEANKSASKPSNPKKKNYTFKEWQLNNKKYDFSTKVTSNITLKAVYVKEEDNSTEEDDGTIKVSSVSLSKTKASLKVGETIKLTATVKPADATNKKVTWSSSNSKVATVNNGVVTAKKGGTAKITVKAGGKTATATIKVLTYTYQIVDVAGSTTGQCYIYIKSSENKRVSGTVTVKYKNGQSETITVPSSGYLWPSRNVISSITNVRGN